MTSASGGSVKSWACALRRQPRSTGFGTAANWMLFDDRQASRGGPYPALANGQPRGRCCGAINGLPSRKRRLSAPTTITRL